MTELSREEVMDWRVLNVLAGRQRMQCKEIKADLEAYSQFEVRLSLKRLMKAKEVIEIRGTSGPIFYEKAHGGYSPGGSAA